MHEVGTKVGTPVRFPLLQECFLAGMHKLTTRKIMSVKTPGRLSDGRGLYLRVKKTGRKSWVYMWSKDHRLREMGLGPYPDVSLGPCHVDRTSRYFVSAGFLSASRRRYEIPFV